ncbi:MAG: hypothetical protein C4567_03945 [Deltaproteobacteria bacterium]|nr:MAG: hypothetical protein C4567_03945 [Deltaproteobacteria bacterium]
MRVFTISRPSGSAARNFISAAGEGMDEETVAHVFEPFFTPQRDQSGDRTGSGHGCGIVNQSGGYIWVYREPKWSTKNCDVYDL